MTNSRLVGGERHRWQKRAKRSCVAFPPPDVENPVRNASGQAGV
jgi:hypothetical protein